MRWISTTFKTSEKSTALDFISLVACNLLHEMRNRWCEESRLELHWVNPRTAAHSINPWATLLCGGEFIVHQDARYHATTFKTSEKSTALYFISLVACNLLHEMGNCWCEEWRSELYWVNPRTAGYSINPWATSCAAWNPSCIKMHATMSYYIKSPKSAVDFNNV